MSDNGVTLQSIKGLIAKRIKELCINVDKTPDLGQCGKLTVDYWIAIKYTPKADTPVIENHGVVQNEVGTVSTVSMATVNQCINNLFQNNGLQNVNGDNIASVDDMYNFVVYTVWFLTQAIRLNYSPFYNCTLYEFIGNPSWTFKNDGLSKMSRNYELSDLNKFWKCVGTIINGNRNIRTCSYQTY